MTLSFAECRAAATAVRRSPYARRAIDELRGTNDVGVFPRRAPLAYTLWVAARDDLLVWQSTDAFTLLEAHGAARAAMFDGGLRYGVARLVDRSWNVVATFTPAGVMLVAGATLLAWRSTRVAGLLCVVATLAYVGVTMTAGLLRPLGRAVRRGPKTDDELIAESQAVQWSVPLLHAADPSRAPDLLRAVQARVRAHVRVAGRAADKELSTMTAGVRAQPAILLRAAGITTDAARDAADAARADVLLRVDGQVPTRRTVIGARFLLLYAISVALVVVVCAYIMAGSEHDACVPACAARPATFSAALRLLLQRLWFTDPPDLRAGTAGGVVISWLVSALTVVSAMVVAAAIRLAVWRQREAAHSFERRRRERMDAKTVVLTALAIEYAAVAEHLTDLAVRDVSGSLYEVGSHRGRRVAIVQTGAGNSRVAFEVERARVAFGPEVMIFVGIAGGRKDVARGDVVAADAVYDYEAGREDAEELRPRFKTYHSSHRLVQHAQRVARDGTWRSRLPGTPQAFIKPLAAGGKVIVDDRARTAKLVEQNAGDALAVEMEGFGFLQGVHASAPTEAIVVRGISDLLTGKTPEHDEMWQPIAARNAAAFAFALLDELDAG